MDRFLGIDIGGTKVAFAVGTSDGAILAGRRRPLAPTGDALRDLARIAEDATALLASAGLRASELAAVGVSAPGPLDSSAGLVLGPPNLPGWTRAPVAEVLAQALGRPVRLENDANAAALAEWRFGAGRGEDDVAYLTLSTGLGAGLVLGSRLHRGRLDGAGEIGHASVEYPGEACACGLSGCLEAYVGGAAWARRLRAIAPGDSRILALAGGREALSPVHAVEAARAGDAFARAELQRVVEYLSRGIANLCFTVSPAVVILGTIAVAAGEELFLAPLRERVRARLWPRLAAEVHIVPAALGERTAELAGICVALEALR